MIPPAGTPCTTPPGINDFGQMVGGFFDGRGAQGFLKDGAIFTTFDVPAATDTEAFTSSSGINDAGQIVGFFFVVGDPNPHSFLATPLPEPASWLLYGSGLVGLIGWKRTQAIIGRLRRIRWAAPKIRPAHS